MEIQSLPQRSGVAGPSQLDEEASQLSSSPVVMVYLSDSPESPATSSDDGQAPMPEQDDTRLQAMQGIFDDAHGWGEVEAAGRAAKEKASGLEQKLAVAEQEVCLLSPSPPLSEALSS